MYDQSPLQQPQLSSLDQFGTPQTTGTREATRQAVGQPQFAQQPQQVAGVQQPPAQQYGQQPQSQQSPVQQGQHAPVQQGQQVPTQQGQQVPTKQYGQQSPIQQGQQSPMQQGPQSPQQAPTQHGQSEQFGATAGIRGQQFQQPTLPSQYGNVGAQTPSWAQTPQFAGRQQGVEQFGQMPQQTGHGQQIPVGSANAQQIPVEHGQSVQQSPWQSAGQHERLHQTVEMADTPTLADALARRLGLTSQQLAQVLPQLGAAIGTQAQGQQGIVGQQGTIPQQGQFPIQGGVQR